MTSEAEDMRILRILPDSAALRDAIALAIAIRLSPSPLCWQREKFGGGQQDFSIWKTLV